MLLFEIVDVIRDERSVPYRSASVFLAALQRRLSEASTEELLLAALEALRDEAELRDALAEIDELEATLRDRLSAEARWEEVLP